MNRGFDFESVYLLEGLLVGLVGGVWRVCGGWYRVGGMEFMSDVGNAVYDGFLLCWWWTLDLIYDETSMI